MTLTFDPAYSAAMNFLCHPKEIFRDHTNMCIPECSLWLISLVQKHGHQRAINVGLVKSSTDHHNNGIPEVRRIMKLGNDYIMLINEKKQVTKQ